MIGPLSSTVSFLGSFLTVTGRAQEHDPDGNAFDFTFTGIDGEQLPLAAYRGRALLIVNTASRCGFARQYGGLETLWQTYRERGLVVIAVPSNDFGGQEPKSDLEILEHCRQAYRVSFPLTQRVHVIGPRAHAFYRWVDEAHGAGARPKWNFHKLLVSPDGRLDAWFSQMVGPRSRHLTSAIERVLPA